MHSWLAKMPYFRARSRAQNHVGAAHPCTPAIPAGRQRTARRRRPCGERLALMVCKSALLPHTQPGLADQVNSEERRMNSFGMPLRSMHSIASSDRYFQSVPQCGTPSLFSILSSLFSLHFSRPCGELTCLCPRSQSRNHAGAAHSRTPPIPAGRQRTAHRRRPCGERLANCRRLLYDRHRISPERRA